MTQWIYPYPTLPEDPSLRLKSVLLDGDPVPSSRFNPDQRQVYLVDPESSDWNRISMEIEMTVDPSDLSGFQKEHGNLAAMAVLNCGRSNARLSLKLDPDGTRAGKWVGHVETGRDTWFGRIDVSGVLAGTIDKVAWRKAAVSPTWSVRLDDEPFPDVNGSISVSWENFREPGDQLGFLKGHEEEPAFLHLESGEPILYLNKGFDGLEPLLGDRQSRGPVEKALHDQARATMAAEVWSGLFNASVQSIRVDDEVPGGVGWPEAEWQAAALNILLDAAFPDKTPDEALKALAGDSGDAFGDAGVAIDLQQRMMIAISRRVGISGLLKSAIKGIEQQVWGED